MHKGFSFVEIILVVAVVVLLGFVGWRVWDAKKEKSAQQNTEQKTEELNPDGYLHIRELGVKMKLPEELKNSLYAYSSKFNTDSAYKSVEIYDPSLIDEYGNCDPAKNNGPFGLLTKTFEKTRKNRDDMSLESNSTTVFKLQDESFVYLTPPQAPCTTNSDLLATKMKAYNEALKTIELDQ